MTYKTIVTGYAPRAKKMAELASVLDGQETSE